MAEEQHHLQGNASRQGAPSIVQSFSADLDSMFGLDANVGQLQQTVDEKFDGPIDHAPHHRADKTGRKHNVTTSHRQLQELEARLRETEERLAKVSRGNSPSRPTDAGASTETDTASPTSRKHLHPSDRPQAAPREDTQTLVSHMPGAMPPPTPRQYSAAGSDYVMVDRGGVERPQQSVR